MYSYMKIRSVSAELSHADGQTDRQTNRKTEITKLIVVFSKFCEHAFKMICLHKHKHINCVKL